MVNTDSHDKPGTHWVCLYVVPPVVEYFDSYGVKPFLPEILNFTDRPQSRAVWNPFDYQALNTTVCGQYSVYYLLQRHKRKKTVQEWMLPFPPSSPMHQDCYIARWFLEKFHPLLITTDKGVNVSIATLHTYNGETQGISVQL